MGCKLFTLADSQSEFVDGDMLILNANHYIVQISGYRPNLLTDLRCTSRMVLGLRQLV